MLNSTILKVIPPNGMANGLCCIANKSVTMVPVVFSDCFIMNHPSNLLIDPVLFFVFRSLLNGCRMWGMEAQAFTLVACYTKKLTGVTHQNHRIYKLTYVNIVMQNALWEAKPVHCSVKLESQSCTGVGITVWVQKPAVSGEVNKASFESWYLQEVSQPRENTVKKPFMALNQ